MKIFVCDYQIPRSDNLDCLIVEAEDITSAQSKAIEELKALNIPSRYLINVVEVI